jgi:hypothetical protein
MDAAVIRWKKICDYVGRIGGIGLITATGGEIWNRTCHKSAGVEHSKMALFRASAIGRCGRWTLVSSYIPPKC